MQTTKKEVRGIMIVKIFIKYVKYLGQAFSDTRVEEFWVDSADLPDAIPDPCSLAGSYKRDIDVMSVANNASYTAVGAWCMERGMLIADRLYDRDGYMKYQESLKDPESRMDCPLCGGDGEFNNGTCKFCKGTGVLGRNCRYAFYTVGDLGAFAAVPPFLVDSADSETDLSYDPRGLRDHCAALGTDLFTYEEAKFKVDTYNHRVDYHLPLGMKKPKYVKPTVTKIKANTFKFGSFTRDLFWIACVDILSSRSQLVYRVQGSRMQITIGVLVDDPDELGKYRVYSPAMGKHVYRTRDELYTSVEDAGRILSERYPECNLADVVKAQPMTEKREENKDADSNNPDANGSSNCSG